MLAKASIHRAARTTQRRPMHDRRMDAGLRQHDWVLCREDASYPTGRRAFIASASVPSSR